MKYYAVKNGRKNGIFQTWGEAEKQVKGFSGAEYKSFKSLEEATAYLGVANLNQYSNAIEHDVDGRFDRQILLDNLQKYMTENIINRLDLENVIASLFVNQDINIYEVEKILEEDGITISNEEVEEENEFIQIDNPFNPEQIDIVMDRIVCINLINRLRNDAFELASDFQRKAGLWSREQKSRLIESIFLNIPLPAFYFDSSDKEKWLVIDGLQRLSTINEFVVKQSFSLTNLEFLKDLEGMKFDDLPYSLKSTIEETNFNAYLIRKNTPKNVKYNIFKRINTGGMVLTSQEIRNALYQGQATKFLVRMAQNENFTKATANSIKTDRMLDREFCLRYIAFTKVPLDKYNNSIDDFLISAMELLNEETDKQLDEYYDEFNRTMEVSYEVFGRYSFRKLRYDNRRTPINKAIFEGWSKVISQLEGTQQDKLIKNKDHVIEKFTEYCEENSLFVNNIKANDKNSIQSRLKIFNSIVSEVLNENN